MANQNGVMYGLTIFSPIIDDDHVTPSHDLQLREYFASLPTGPESPFAQAPFTHLARLFVLDDVVFVGKPSKEEHLKSKYLIFESNFDGDLDTYLMGLVRYAPEHVDATWSHCVGYPGIADAAAFVRYMKACQLETTFYFGAVNSQTLTQTLKALQTQRLVAEFIASHQASKPAALQHAFAAFLMELRAQPLPRPGRATIERTLQTGGHNE